MSMNEDYSAAIGSCDEALRILGLSRGASDDEIRSRYHRLMKQFHPDAVGADEPNDVVYFVRAAYEYLQEHYDGQAAAQGTADAHIVGGVDAVYRAQRSTGDGAYGDSQASPHPAADSTSGKILGSSAQLAAASERRRERKRYQAKQREYEDGRQERQQQKEREILAEAAERRYEEAMDRIHAERAAEVTAQIIRAVLFGERQGDTSDIK